ncbi:MAG TPA: hypothetical protein VIF34_07190 [Methylocystis sp.]|jgi:hypothetical protein
MNSEVERFLAEIVDPTIRDFESNPASVRHAFLACLTTFHALDRFEGKRNLRKSFRDELPEFAVVDRVAHAFKHVGTGNHKDENNQPLSDQDLIERSPARCGQARCGLSRLGDLNGGVTIRSEIEKDLLRSVKRAAAFLAEKAAADR